MVTVRKKLNINFFLNVANWAVKGQIGWMINLWINHLPELTAIKSREILDSSLNLSLLLLPSIFRALPPLKMTGITLFAVLKKIYNKFFYNKIHARRRPFLNSLFLYKRKANNMSIFGVRNKDDHATTWSSWPKEVNK